MVFTCRLMKYQMPVNPLAASYGRRTCSSVSRVMQQGVENKCILPASVYTKKKMNKFNMQINTWICVMG